MIHRYDLLPKSEDFYANDTMQPEPNGDWILYADHLTAIAAKDAEIAELRSISFAAAALLAEHAKNIDDLSQEAVALRVDAMRYRYLRTLWKHDHFATAVQPDGDPTSCDAAIDAARAGGGE